MQAEMPGRRQPVGQNREGLLARPTHSAPRPEGSALIVVALAKSLSVADDRVVAADRTTPRQKDQRDRSGVDVVFCLWQCDKKNQGWREGPAADRPLPKFRSAAGPSPSGKVSFDRKKNTALRRQARGPQSELWPV